MILIARNDIAQDLARPTNAPLAPDHLERLCFPPPGVSIELMVPALIAIAPQFR